jgi:hypothetical protein
MAQSFEFQNAGINRSAITAWSKLCKAQDENDSYPCKDNPYFFTDYQDAEDVVSEDYAEELCHGCPLLKVCYDFAVANGEKFGIWGGIDMGRSDDNLW